VRYIDYNTGVQQGDNVAPILFIFVMLAVSTALKDKWTLNSPNYGHLPSSDWRKRGGLINQNYRAKCTLLELFHILFDDDITFLFETLEELRRGAKLIHDHYARFD
jgi:hypothetical protein